MRFALEDMVTTLCVHCELCGKNFEHVRSAQKDADMIYAGVFEICDS
jgi:hypothetical protein